MFARWMFVRISAAEKALREGRLDEACVAALQPEIRQHPRGQRLLDELVRPLVARVRLHRQAGRYREALADLDTLSALGRPAPDAAELRQRIEAEMRTAAAQAADDQAAAGRAAQELREGRLESCRLNVARVDDERQREKLAEELNVRVERVAQLVAQAGAALDGDDVLAAARYWREACERHGRTRETDALGARLAGTYRRVVPQWVWEGRIERLLAARAVLGGLTALDPAMAECERVVGLCARAVELFATGDYAGLRQTLLRLKGVSGDVAWIGGALDALGELSRAQEALLASPLGVYASLPGKAASLAERPPRPSLESEATDPGAVRLEQPLLVLVDGGGSALLVRRAHVRIGRAGGSGWVAVALPADVQSHHAEIVRCGEDYFLTAYGPVTVNRRRVEHTLLRDGDRIVLGDSAKMVFARPSAKSTTAVLRLSHRCRLPQDVSEVILFDETCLLGGGPSCHVRTTESSGQVVLFERGGGLYARQTGGNGWLSAAARAVSAGETLEFGELRVTVKPYA